MALHRLSDLTAYFALLQKLDNEVESLHDDILIHVTGFFREPESFLVLKDAVLPSILADRADRPGAGRSGPGCRPVRRARRPIRWR